MIPLATAYEHQNPIYMYCWGCREPAAYSGNNSWKSTFYT